MASAFNVNPAVAWAAKTISNKKGIDGKAMNRTKLSTSYLDVLGPLGEHDGATANKLASERRDFLSITPEMMKQWKADGQKTKPQRI